MGTVTGQESEAVRHDAPRRAASPPILDGRGEHDRSRAARAGADLAHGRASAGLAVRGTGQPGDWPRYLPTPAERERLAATLGATLRALRAEYGLSVARLAERAAAHPSTVARLEAGERRPRPSMLASLAYAFDPARAAEIAARLVEAAGPSLRPDTEGSIRRRARRMERARRAARREAWRMERAAADAGSEAFHLLCRVLRKLPLGLAFTPGLTPGELARAGQRLAALEAARLRADALFAARDALTAALAAPRHPLEGPSQRPRPAHPRRPRRAAPTRPRRRG